MQKASGVPLQVANAALALNRLRLIDFDARARLEAREIRGGGERISPEEFSGGRKVRWEERPELPVQKLDSLP